MVKILLRRRVVLFLLAIWCGLAPSILLYGEEEGSDLSDDGKDDGESPPMGGDNGKATKSSVVKEKLTPKIEAPVADDKKGAEILPAGKELVNMDFPEPTEIKDIIKAVALWTGKNVILDRNVSGKVQIISPKKVTKEEAYQAFLSALNILSLTTVETGKIIKIMKVRSAVKDNLKTYQGSGWAPRTDEIITQIIPLKYIDAKQISSTLSRIVSSNSMIPYEPTNTLIVSDSGFKVRRILEILELLDVQTQQPKVLIVPIKYDTVKSIADKVNEILKASSQNKKGGYNAFKILQDERSNSIIIFGPPRTIADIRELVKTFDVPLDDPALQATIHVRPLDYADAKKLAATLSALAGGAKNQNGFRRPPVKGAGDSATVADLGDGKITADDASNSLLITGSKATYDALNSIIRKLDIRRSQVFVEADILDIKADDKFNFGTSIFSLSGTEKGTKYVEGWEAGKFAPIVGAAAAGKGGTVSAQGAQSFAGTFNENLNVAILAGRTVNVPGVGELTPGGLISMMKTDANTRVLSSPHILTSNNEEAVISVGEKRYFDAGSTMTPTGTVSSKVEKEDVDLTLTIKPNISNSNYITMNVNLESNGIGSTDANGRPSINKRKSKQIVTVKDGQTVVISGLMSTDETESYKKVPLLGDIPVLGWLFRNSLITKNKTNLSIFLTPHEVNGAADLAAIYKAKLEERDVNLKSIYGSSVVDSDFYKLLPKQEDGAYKPTKLDEKEDRRLQVQKDAGIKARGYEEEQEKSEEVPAPGQSTSGSEREISVPLTLDGDASGGGLAPSSGSGPASVENIGGGDVEPDLSQDSPVTPTQNPNPPSAAGASDDDEHDNENRP